MEEEESKFVNLSEELLNSTDGKFNIKKSNSNKIKIRKERSKENLKK